MRILSYNIHKGIGGRDRLYRLERIIEVIAVESPDVICLQEVDRNVKRSGFDDQPRLLAERFSAVGTAFQFNHKVKEGGYGNLVLTRWPMHESHQISLKVGLRKNRGAQVVFVETPEGRLRVVNWHLGLAEHERHRQVHQVLEHDLHKSRSGLPTIMIGDTNDWRNTLGHGPFAEHGLRQVTSPTSHFRSFPAMFAIAALDKAFASSGIEVEHAKIVQSSLARQASDHLPLIVDFHLKRT